MDEDIGSSAPAPEETTADQQGATAAAVEQAETAQSSQVSDEEVKRRLLVLLGHSDLTKTTEKMLRRQLEKDLGVDLGSKKALIRHEVLEYLEQHQPADDDDEAGSADEEMQEEVVEEKPAKKRGGGGGFGGPCLLSEELQAFTGQEKMTRSQIVKSIWDYIKANELQNPKDKRQIIIDDKLGTIFKPPLTMFSMNKQLTKHVFKASDVKGGGDSDDDDDEAPAKPKSKPAKRARKAAGSDDEGAPKRKPSGFCKPLQLSEAFAATCGKPEMSRGEVTKWIYGYVEQHNLKDPSDKRYAMCDDTLKQLTGEKRIMLFGSQKYFKKHLLG